MMMIMVGRRRMKMKLKKKMDTQCQYCITTEHGSWLCRANQTSATTIFQSIMENCETKNEGKENNCFGDKLRRTFGLALFGKSKETPTKSCSAVQYSHGAQCTHARKGNFFHSIFHDDVRFGVEFISFNERGRKIQTMYHHHYFRCEWYHFTLSQSRCAWKAKRDLQHGNENQHDDMYIGLEGDNS